MDEETILRLDDMSIEMMIISRDMQHWTSRPDVCDYLKESMGKGHKALMALAYELKELAREELLEVKSTGNKPSPSGRKLGGLQREEE